MTCETGGENEIILESFVSDDEALDDTFHRQQYEEDSDEEDTEEEGVSTTYPLPHIISAVLINENYNKTQHGKKNSRLSYELHKKKTQKFYLKINYLKALNHFPISTMTINIKISE